ncbi:MAG: tRNA (cytidine(34)-2'-O)-methyltransferase [Proteobacteria bacterium]|jgi:tRNA (cytidine/uridine-2'-O-)-methyltransferase|nr:tRNA (cytidine(34)-2'-O)-methyltransferase [Pseudomonadota bacterium]
MKSSDILTSGRSRESYPVLFTTSLIQPEIPQNTGNIGRTCVSSCSFLEIVGPLGFKITDSNLKRAGLDYWKDLNWQYFEDRDSWERSLSRPERTFYFSAKSERLFYDVEFKRGDRFVFGQETVGLPDDMMQQNSDRVLQLPILGPVRGLNVATAVAVVHCEAIRQLRLRGEIKPQDFRIYRD